MRRVKFLFFLLPAIIFLFVFSQQVLAETVELTPTADSFVNDGYPESNYGSAHSLVISYNSVFRWSLIRFDLTSLPEDALVDSAILKAYLYDSSGDASVPLMAAKITSDWSEGEVKWNNRPMFDEPTGVNVNIDTTSGYKSWEITNFVRGWLNGDFSNYGVGFGYGAGSYARSFRSREYASDKPVLTVNYHLPEPTPTPSPTPTPTPTPKATPTLTPVSEEEEITPSPELSPTPTPESEERKILGFFSPGQAVIGGLILLALIAAGGSFAAYSLRKPKKTEKPKKREEKSPPEETVPQEE